MENATIFLKEYINEVTASTSSSIVSCKLISLCFWPYHTLGHHKNLWWKVDTAAVESELPG